MKRSGSKFFSAIAAMLILLSGKMAAQPLAANGGGNFSVCVNDSVMIGGSPAASGGTLPYTFSWSPTSGLSNPAASNPLAFPASSTAYVLTVTDGAGNTSSSTINVTVLPLPLINAGPDQTILGGHSTQLQATGATIYAWAPQTDLINPNTATPTAEPGVSTTYCVAGADENGCINFDCMEINVIESDTIVLYNAFTPNGDGNNDFYYIGNLAKFPDNKLEVYNRNGKLVYQASHYGNDWNGKVEGTELPCATYYIVLDLGPGSKKVHGAVTIIR